MHISKSRLTLCLTAALAITLFIAACDTDDIAGPEDPEIAAIIISPSEAEIGVGEQEQLSFELHDESGQPVDRDGLDMEIEWITTDPDVVTLDQSGLATGQSPGQEYCIIDVTVHKGSSNFTGRDTAIVFVR